MQFSWEALTLSAKTLSSMLRVDVLKMSVITHSVSCRGLGTCLCRCNNGVRTAVFNDPQKRFRLAALQSNTGRALQQVGHFEMAHSHNIFCSPLSAGLADMLNDVAGHTPIRVLFLA